MSEYLLELRNRFTSFGYKHIVRKIFFRLAPETIHHRMIVAGKVYGSNLITRKLISMLFSYSNKTLNQHLLGVYFKNPIGLAAGFDKSAEIGDILPSVGFGFIEVGSITEEPREGTKKRYWRLVKSEATMVDCGLKNDGSEKIAERLKKKKFGIPLWTNVIVSPKEENMQDKLKNYIKAYKRFAHIGKFFVINVTDIKILNKLLTKVGGVKTNKKIFLKISPDLTHKQIDEIIKISRKHDVDGFICTHVTKKKEGLAILDEDVPETGGISGKLVKERSNQVLKYVYHETKGEFVIVGCGGVFSAEDAYEKIKLGASLVQVLTGMIFEGPQLIGEINKGLAKLLEKDGFSHLSEAIGVENK